VRESTSAKRGNYAQECNDRRRQRAQHEALQRSAGIAWLFNVIQTRNGIEALDLARAHMPDLILMDIQLPEVSGLVVTKWLKDDEQLAAHSRRSPSLPSR
jgi:CheY-like chemotaxis protein